METTLPIIKYTFSEEEEKKEILRQYRGLLKELKPKLKPGDKELIRTAFEIAVEAHKTMRRKSGEPYILHPLAVARICVEEIGLGVRSTICALLHDTVEDTDITLQDIQREFGAEIAKIVDGLTKISTVMDTNTSQQAENFKKILLTLTDDPRVILIKLSDRLHNMRTMDSMKREKQLKISSETVYVYAPLAHRMGLYAIKTEMEDLAMKYLEPDTYKYIAQKLTDTKRERTRFINDFIRPLKDKLEKADFKFEIYGRVTEFGSRSLVSLRLRRAAAGRWQFDGILQHRFRSRRTQRRLDLRRGGTRAVVPACGRSTASRSADGAARLRAQRLRTQCAHPALPSERAGSRLLERLGTGS